MKKSIICLTCVIATQLLFGQASSPEYKSFIRKADSLYKLKEYKNSAQNYSLAFKTLAWKGLVADRYNAARSWTLANIPDSAFFCLERIVNKGYYSSYDEIVLEEDFNTLHSDKRWQPLIDQIKRNKLPTGWFRTGGQMSSYKMFIDSSAGQEGKNALSIKSIDSKIIGFGALNQTFLADKYLGKRIRMTGYLKSKDVKGWSGLMLRVDKEDATKYLQFDNMFDRSIRGTTEWKKYELVLDVPKSASRIIFGALLNGTGQIWFEKITFEEVDLSVPVTGKIKDVPNVDLDK